MSTRVRENASLFAVKLGDSRARNVARQSRFQDFEEEEETIWASRLGYRITWKFVGTFFGRMLAEARSVFTEEMLRPELQSHEQFVDVIKNIMAYGTHDEKRSMIPRFATCLIGSG